MSVWTHIDGIIRIDGLPSEEGLNKIKDIFGPMALVSSEKMTNEDWNKYKENYKNTKLPKGSEGSIQYKIIEYDTGFPYLAIPIWGDLRDYGKEKIGEIEEWINFIVEQINLTFYIIRSFIILVNTENCENNMIFVIDDNNKIIKVNT